MTDNCCSTLTNKKCKCPVNGHTYTEVPYATLLHHVKNAWQANLKQQKYFFCDDPECDVVYFGEDASLIYKNELRTQVGIKSQATDAIVCYCFGIDRVTALKHPSTRDFIIHQTRLKNCSCTTCNPSGRCCLKDFPEH